MTRLIKILRIFPRRTVFDKVLHDKAFNVVKNPKCDGYRRELTTLFYNFLEKKSSCGAVICANKSSIKSETLWNEKLAEEIQKPIIIKFEKRKSILIF